MSILTTSWRDGRYTLQEIECAEGYLLDTQPKTVYVKYGGCTTITWENTAVTGQIQVTSRPAPIITP